MKCSGCKYRQYTQAESDEMTCSVFGDETPEKYERKDGDGCTCNRQQLEKMLRESEKAWIEEAKRFVEFMESEGNHD